MILTWARTFKYNSSEDHVTSLSTQSTRLPVVLRHAAWDIASHQALNICKTLIQRRPNVFDVGPTLYQCYANVLCLLR